MTGADHYERAEHLLWKAAMSDYDERECVPALLAAAQVHATLALAAATAVQPHTYHPDRQEWKQWQTAALDRSPENPDACVCRLREQR